MTTLDFSESRAAGAGRTVPPAGLRRLWSSLRRRRAERRALTELMRLNAHVLRDLGIEPLDVYDAYRGRGQSVLFNPMRRAGDE